MHVHKNIYFIAVQKICNIGITASRVIGTVSRHIEVTILSLSEQKRHKLLLLLACGKHTMKHMIGRTERMRICKRYIYILYMYIGIC